MTEIYEDNTLPDSEVTAELEKGSWEQKAAEAEAIPLPVFSLDVFCVISGVKWDQMAGFRHYAGKHLRGPRTIAAWKAEYAAFQNKPTH